MDFEEKLSDLSDDELVELVKAVAPKGDMPKMYDLLSVYGEGWDIPTPELAALARYCIARGCPPSLVLVRYADGADYRGEPLAPRVIALVSKHLAECEECREEVALLRSDEILP